MTAIDIVSLTVGGVAIASFFLRPRVLAWLDRRRLAKLVKPMMIHPEEKDRRVAIGEFAAALTAAEVQSGKEVPELTDEQMLFWSCPDLPDFEREPFE